MKTWNRSPNTGIAKPIQIPGGNGSRSRGESSNAEWRARRRGYLKKPENGTATLSIHTRNDLVKNRGYGTQAEILTMEYAFEALGVQTVFADAHKNKRSQHVLEKVGFRRTHQDNHSVYYRCDRESWDGMKFHEQPVSNP